MIILGIETSCDETALALIETRGVDDSAGKDGKHLEYRIIQSLVHSQAKLHSAYGGVFPTLAKREHSKNLVPLLDKILKDLPDRNNQIPRDKVQIKTHSFTEKFEEIKKQYAEQNGDLVESLTHAHFLENIPNIDKIAVTEGPGLEPALWVGITFARILGELWSVPVIPVDHMEGHVVGSLLSNDKPYGTWQKLKELPLPAVALLISGGHTELIKVTRNKKQETNKKSVGNNDLSLVTCNLKFEYTLLGQTRDDAVGEAFDKVARLLGLPYPGGPHISRLAHEAWEEKIKSPVKLPRPMINSGDLNFSFSGLKTAVLYAIQDAQKNCILLNDLKVNISDNSAGLHLINQEKNIDNVKRAEIFKKGLAYEFEQSVAEVLDSKLQQAIEDTGAQSVIIGGGVSANHVLRHRFQTTTEKNSIPLFLPSLHVAGDNALMIALVVAMNDSAIGPKDIRAHGTKKITE